MSPTTDKKLRILALYVAEGHQVLHTYPAIAELSLHEDVEAWTATTNDDQLRQIARLGHAYNAALPNLMMGMPGWAGILSRLDRRFRDGKVLRLLHYRNRLNEFDAVICAERTSIILKRFGVQRPLMIHIPHGAGDRARGFDPRIARFDHVILQAPKDELRMLKEGLVRPGAYDVCGYVKFEAVEHMSGKARRLFPNSNPVILYNPHFDKHLGSWTRFGKNLVAAILERTKYNLIVAPHVRLARRHGMTSADFHVEGYEGRLIVDPGSDASYDMTYTRAADIYLGDVSSQVYEFLYPPRPCVFLLPSGVERQESEDFAFHRFGETVKTLDAAIIALREAPGRHPEFIDFQKNGAGNALGPRDGQVAKRMADAVFGALHSAGKPVRDLPRKGRFN